MQGQGPYTAKIKKIEADILEEMKNVQELMGAFSAKHPTVARPCKRCTRTSLSDSPKPVRRLGPQRVVLCCFAPHGTGVKESDTGLSKPNTWDLIADKQMLEKEAPLLVRGRPTPPLCCVLCCASAPSVVPCPLASHAHAGWGDVGVGVSSRLIFRIDDP